MKFLLSRLIQSFVALFLIFTLSFAVMRAVPGGPFDRERHFPPEVRQALTARYGLDQPLLRQYITYLNGVLHLDLGPSLQYRDLTVREIIVGAFPASLSLGLWTIAFVLVGGFGLGLALGQWRGRLWAWPAQAAVILGLSVPSLVLGPLLIVTLVLWPQVSGIFPPLPYGGLATPLHYLLPVISLGLAYLVSLARLIEGGLRDLAGEEFVLLAKAKGLSRRGLLLRHLLRPALLPALQYLGPLLATLITGSIIVEQLFHIPGLGQHFVRACQNRDYPLILGTVCFYSVLLLGCNFVVDFLSARLDPRLARKERP